MAGHALVVDADIVCSAGETRAHDQRPRRCAEFLEAILTHGHTIILTNDLFEEWRRRRSRFATSWLRSAFARKRVQWVTPSSSLLRDKFNDLDIAATERAAMQKDRHLIDAALASDRRIASLDETARALFTAAAATPQLRVITNVMWVNPELGSDRAVEWLV